MEGKETPKMTLGELLAGKEPMGEGEKAIVASLIDNLAQMAKLNDREFNLKFTSDFVNRYWNGAPFDSNTVSSLGLAISALRDSGKIGTPEIKRLEILENWLQEIRGT